MNDYSDSGDRRAGEYVPFVLVFIGFVIGGSGVIVSSPAVALTGAALAWLPLVAVLRGSAAER
jgi:hypothetical protein